jgi:uncharacterized protein with HEPN domain
VTRDSADRIRDILTRVESIGEAEAMMARAEAEGDSSTVRIAYNSILYDLVVLGEAVRALPDDLRDSEPDIPWRQIVGMRNRLAHEYFRPDLDLVALTIDAPLQNLQAACGRLLRELT